MTRPDGDDGDATPSAKDGFDDAWGELVDSASEKIELTDESPAGTKPWTETVRGERKRDAEPAEPSPSPSASSSALLGPDPERLHESADVEMARMMKPDPVPSPSPELELDPEDDSVEPEPASRTMLYVAVIAAVIGVGYFAFGSSSEKKPEPAANAEVAKKTERPKPDDPALARGKVPKLEEPPDAKGGRLSDPKPDAGGDAKVEAQGAAKVDAEGEAKVDAEGEAKVDAEGEAKVDAGSKTDAKPSADGEREIKRSGDPRQVPEGTSPDNAAAFRKLPVSPADLPPVGAVGQAGVHVDRIGMGSAFERTRCAGKTDAFSVASQDRINVCFRVVHPRQKEELIVLWQKDGGTVRRGKVVVKPAHAYRTRAYLVLRNEYVGKWKVRILDQEGAELASHPFTVVE